MVASDSPIPATVQDLMEHIEHGIFYVKEGASGHKTPSIASDDHSH